MTDERDERRRLVYSGRVQGVGFRATAASIARRHRVKGYVRNRSDGTVELVVDGRSGEIDRFLNDVAGAMGDNIADVRSEPIASEERLDGFDVRY